MLLKGPFHPEHTRRLVSLIRNSSRILVFTGAGLSTSSGIPDFRGPGGVWERRRPVYYDDFMSNHAARVEHWDFKLEGWEAYHQAQPNDAHRAIARLEEAGKLLLLVTQNIDGLHRRAGISAERLVEIHGTNLEVECQTCKRIYEPGPIYKEFAETGEPPLCADPECRGYLKPATISFGQTLRMEDVEAAEKAAGAADLVIAMGSTLSVYPASRVPLMAAARGVPYAIINRGDTDHDHRPEVTVRLEGDVLDLVPSLINQALS